MSARLAKATDGVSRLHVSVADAHTIVNIARACLSCLLRLDKEVTSISSRSFPLAEYTAQNWVEHARCESPHRISGLWRDAISVQCRDYIRSSVSRCMSRPTRHG